jgi:hypothetical protein
MARLFGANIEMMAGKSDSVERTRGKPASKIGYISTGGTSCTNARYRRAHEDIHQGLPYFKRSFT